MIGTTLSHFKITAKLGEGGMGEVYRAEDTKLGREVAIKVLPEAVAEDPERLARFEREAKVLASLNHPNIAGIHSPGRRSGAGEHASTSWSWSWSRARTCRTNSRGPIPLDEALPIARQIAEALEAAHERGIVHRDLKPANVKVDARRQGQGARLRSGQGARSDGGRGAPCGLREGASPLSQGIAQSPTLTAQMTNAGVILGTAAYMSPEQARGQTVDNRSDIWAFGLVCFEMLTGKRLFAADTVSDTLAGVIKTEVDFDDLPTDLPPSFRRLLRRCLERDPRRRLHDVADGRIVIEDIQSGATEETVAATPHAAEAPAGWRRLLPYVVGLVGLLVGLWALATTWTSEPPAASPGTALQFAVFAPLELELSTGLAISPDGTQLVYVARGGDDGRTELRLRRPDSLEARILGGTDEARYPFWSPDSSQVGYFANGQLMVTDLISDSPRALAPTSTSVNVRGAAWGADDTIVYAPTFTGPFMRISATGGEAEPATRMPDDGLIGTHRFPTFLPDGRHFVFFASDGSGTEPGTLSLGELGSLWRP